MGSEKQIVLHITLGVLNPTLDLRDVEVMLASHFSDGGFAFKNIHDHAGFALGGPAFDGGLVTHLVLLIAAL